MFKHLLGYLKVGEGWVRVRGREERVLSAHPKLEGEHNRLNLLASGLALYLFGIPGSVIEAALDSFEGIEHRLERFAEKGGISYINDSAATIPQATVEALKTVPAPIHLITGGTDKNLNFTSLVEAAEPRRKPSTMSTGQGPAILSTGYDSRMVM